VALKAEAEGNDVLKLQLLSDIFGLDVTDSQEFSPYGIKVPAPESTLEKKVSLPFFSVGTDASLIQRNLKWVTAQGVKAYEQNSRCEIWLPASSETGSVVGSTAASTQDIFS